VKDKEIIVVALGIINIAHGMVLTVKRKRELDHVKLTLILGRVLRTQVVIGLPKIYQLHLELMT
jgi:hypothetical protein